MLTQMIQARSDAKCKILDAQRDLDRIERSIIKNIIENEHFDLLQVNWRKIERDQRRRRG